MYRTPFKSLTCVGATLLLALSPNVAAQTTEPEHPAETEAPPPALTITPAKDQWQFRLTGELFSFDADYSQTVFGWEYESDRTGELYGGTLGIKWPGMSEGNWIELLYRTGSLDGKQYYYDPSLPPVTEFDSDMTQFGLAIKGETSSKKNKHGIPNRRWVWSLGYAYTQWESTETAPPGFLWANTGTRYLEDTATFHLLEVTGGYSWAPLAVRTGDNSFFRLGPRLEGTLGIGVSLLESDWHDDDTQLAFDFGGRALLFADWTVNNLTVGVEGGYQYIQYYSTIANDYYDENDSYSEAMSGLIARVECSVRF